MNADIPPPGYKTDHSLVTIIINTKSNPRCPGFWKLNTSLLFEQEYVELIKKAISVVSEQYKYDNEIDDIRKRILCEVLKMEIRASSISFAKQIKLRIANLEATLELEIQNLVNETKSCSTDEDRDNLVIK